MKVPTPEPAYFFKATTICVILCVGLSGSPHLAGLGMWTQALFCLKSFFVIPGKQQRMYSMWVVRAKGSRIYSLWSLTKFLLLPLVYRFSLVDIQWDNTSKKYLKSIFHFRQPPYCLLTRITMPVFLLVVLFFSPTLHLFAKKQWNVL